MAPPAVERILARLRESGDFPAMARTVSQIGELTSSEDTSTSALADTVLRDYGLAQKLLGLVNTVAFAQHNQVTTISRAVLLLGFERVRTVATGLMLFEHLQAQARTPELADALNRSFYSAILARGIADETSFADPEESFISALFHNLGRSLVTLYMPEELAAIRAAGDGRESEAVVQREIGMSYGAVGMAVATALNLPARLTRSMARVAGTDARDSMSDVERLGCLATLSNGITETLASGAATRDRKAAIERLVRSYGRVLGGLDGKIDRLIRNAVRELREDSQTFQLELPGSAFLDGLGDWQAESLRTPDGEAAIASASEAGGLIDVAEPDTAEADELPETVLTRGLHELTCLLVTEFSLDDVLRVILETVYRALGVGGTRTFFLLKDPSAPLARFRFGLGQSASEMRAWLGVAVDGPDLFGIAFERHKDVVIRDSSAPDAAPLLPDWHRGLLATPRYIVVLPLSVGDRTLGLFYVDGPAEDARLLTSAVLNYFKVLRGQAAVAIHQRSTRSTARRR